MDIKENLMSTAEWEKVLQQASKDMCKALNSFGSGETLRLLLEFSQNDPIVNELLTRYPSIVAIGDFLIGKPTVQVDEKTFQTLMESNPDIWIKNNPKAENKISEKTPQMPKRTRSRKRNLTST
jgi:hypothetical protein